MTEKQKAIISLLLTLDELHKEGADVIPASHIYMALGMDMGHYEAIRAEMSRLGWIETTVETVMLTEQGKKTASEIRDLIAEEQKK